METLLNSLLENRQVAEQGENVPPEMAGIYDKVVQLQKMHQEMQQYAVRLSFGQSDAEPPPRDNYLAAGLKQLQAQLLHLTWQARRVAQGDYNQRIDFMGDFSTAFNNMTDQLRQRETRLREQQDAMVNIFDKVEPIFVVDLENNGEVLYANRLAMEIFGMENGDELARNEAMACILQTPVGNEEHHVQDPSTEKWFSVSSNTLHWSNHPAARLYYCRDITTHKERETDLGIAANTDELTGISNRRAFEQSLSRLWDACMQAQKPLSLILFDIDHFKVFNDTYGHLQGDKALKYFSGVLKRRIGRVEDSIARYGGEEFIVLLPYTTQESAMQVAESVRKGAEEGRVAVDLEGKGMTQIPITVSGGVSTVIPSDHYVPSQLIQAADSAMYSAKQYGRNKVYYQPIGAMPGALMQRPEAL